MREKRSIVTLYDYVKPTRVQHGLLHPLADEGVRRHKHQEASASKTRRLVGVGWQFPLGFGLGGRLLLARPGRVCV